jgi:Bacterial protein of unknown function (DUF899)
MLISTYCTPSKNKMQAHPVVSQQQWLVARKPLLWKTKEFTHLRDKINAARLALPRVRLALPRVGLRRITSLKLPRAKRLYLNCSMAEASSLCTTSCLARAGKRLPRFFISLRSYRWRPSPTRTPRCHLDCRLPCAVGGNRGIQAAHEFRTSTGV